MKFLSPDCKMMAVPVKMGAGFPSIVVERGPPAIPVSLLQESRAPDEHDGICLAQPIRDGQVRAAKQHFAHQGVEQLLHVWPQPLSHSSVPPRAKCYDRLYSFKRGYFGEA
jgi:hypothetical protein